MDISKEFIETVKQKVYAENTRFREKLPQLLKEIPGKWVVFLHNEVQSSHETEDEAYVSAVRQFGEYAGFVIACVEVPRVKYISAAARFFEK